MNAYISDLKALLQAFQNAPTVSVFGLRENARRRSQQMQTHGGLEKPVQRNDPTNSMINAKSSNLRG